ncbi:hypothetical protein D3C75_872750 [compost metagenome]
MCHQRPQHNPVLLQAQEVEHINQSPRRAVIIRPGADNRLHNICGPLQMSAPDGAGQHEPVGGMYIIMNANLMAFPVHSLDQLRISFRLRTKDEKGGFYFVLCQKIQQSGGVFRMRPVIKGESHLLGRCPPAHDAISGQPRKQTGN